MQGGARLLGALGAGTPDFVLGTLLVYVFSVWSLGLTVGDYVPFAADPLGNLRSMALPAITLSLHGIALILRTTRDAVLVVLGSPHITTAVARGEAPGRLLRRQVVRNAALPVLTVTTMYFSALMGGAVIGAAELIDRLRTDFRVLGGTLDPHAAFLLQRGLRTHAVRYREQSRAALALK